MRDPEACTDEDDAEDEDEDCCDEDPEFPEDELLEDLRRLGGVVEGKGQVWPRFGRPHLEQR